MAIAATRSQHDASGAAMIHLGDIGPARIHHVHVGVLLKENVSIVDCSLRTMAFNSALQSTIRGVFLGGRT